MIDSAQNDVKVVARFFAPKQLGALELTTDKESSRFCLWGIQVSATDFEGLPHLRAVGTDGRRLASYSWEGVSGADFIPAEGIVLIPECFKWPSAKSISALKHMKTKAAQRVSVYSDHSVKIEFGCIGADGELFVTETRIVKTGICEGRFPNVDRVHESAPAEAFTMVNVDAKLLIDLLKQAIAALDGEGAEQTAVCLAVPNDNPEALNAIRVVAGNGFQSLVMPMAKMECDTEREHIAGELGTRSKHAKLSRRKAQAAKIAKNKQDKAAQETAVA